MKKKYIKDYVATSEGKLEYRGKYFTLDISDEDRKSAGMIQMVYGILCVMLLLAALCIPCQGNKTIYVVIPMELALVCLWAYLTSTWAFLRVGSRMEEKDYDKAYQNPIQALTVSILLYVFSFGGQIIGIVMNSKVQEKGDLYFSLVLFFVLVISIVIWNRQRKVMHLVKEESKK